jgi:transcriptional regulator with XRE-family HTH domain
MDIIVAENLKKLREKHNLTQEALALEWGVPELDI